MKYYIQSNSPDSFPTVIKPKVDKFFTFFNTHH